MCWTEYDIGNMPPLPYPMFLPPFYFHMVELPQNFPNFRDMP